MADQAKELIEVPREFIKEGTQFMNRCTKPDKREFFKISQAVGVGFIVMGAIGFVVKLIHIPVNNILVS
ncbi:protein translocase SEC6 [Tothia fuscella]|uniref:Protein translocase SEC6 n=1 Tax=Tothia fuscella TaxID=1048955 RepID=A0A9P4P2F6_9PEZI|nr:protein translocase SEC6 [Tothia fuscella]